MSTETSRFPSGELRASDADRDLAIAELSEHFQTGRLTRDEFDERSARALRARTGRELSELFADLPGGDSPRGMADSAGLGEPGRVGRLVGLAGSVTAVRRDVPGADLDRSVLLARPRPARPVASCRRPVPFAIVGIVAVIAVASLLGIGHGGFGWLIPVFIVLVVVRRIAGHR